MNCGRSSWDPPSSLQYYVKHSQRIYFYYLNLTTISFNAVSSFVKNVHTEIFVNGFMLNKLVIQTSRTIQYFSNLNNIESLFLLFCSSLVSLLTYNLLFILTNTSCWIFIRGFQIRLYTWGTTTWQLRV